MKLVEKPTILNGEYLITDPCYVVPDSRWYEFCELTWEQAAAVIDVDGFEIFVAPTAYGDGSYPVFQNGYKVGEFGVDAGLFAIIPIDFPGAREFAKRTDLATVVRVAGTPSYDGDGNATVGDVVIDTRGEWITEEEGTDEDGICECGRYVADCAYDEEEEQFVHKDLW